MQQKTYETLIKKRFIMILTIISFFLIVFTFFILQTQNEHKKQFSLIDEIGHQKMLSQKMTFYAYQKVQLLDPLESNELNDHSIINEKLNQSIQKFEDSLFTLSRKDYKRNFNFFYRDNLNSILLDNYDLLDEEWKKYKYSLEVILNSEVINEEVLLAYKDITTHSDQFLIYYDHLSQDVVKQLNTTSTFNKNFVLIVFLMTFSIFLFFQTKLYKYIIIPLNILYHGIQEKGLVGVQSIPTNKELKPIINEINDSVEQFNSLKVLIENINQGDSFEKILNYIYNSFSFFIPYSHIGIAMLNEDGTVLKNTHAISDPILGDLPKQLEGLEAKLVDTSLEKVISSNTTRVINDLHNPEINRTKDYNRIILESGIRSSITLPLLINNRPIGIIFFSSVNKNVYTEKHISFLKILSNSIAISFNNSIFIDELLYSTILALAKLAESRDLNTGNHLERMKKYARLIVESMYKDQLYKEEINSNYIKDIEKFSPLHDIGKVGIPDSILLKPGKLTKEEFEKMKQHTIYGAKVLRTAEQNIEKHHKSLFKMGIEIAESHQEKWDGTGYPYQLKGEEIPLSARIVAAADVLDALTSKRPYKEAFTFEESFQMIVNGRGTHFDPVIVDCMIRNKEKIYAIYIEKRVINK